MPTARIPFGPAQSSGNEALAGAGVVAHNVVLDGAGAVLRRPGIQASSLSVDAVIDSAGVEGIVTTPNQELWAVGAAVNGDRTIYRVTPGGFISVGGSFSPRLNGTGRPVITQTEAIIVATAGAAPQKVDWVDEISDRLGGTPPNSTHIALQSSRLVSNNVDVQSRVNYSGIATGGAVAGHEDWDPGVGTGGLFSAEARADPVVALAENTNELYVWGTTSVQVFVPDGQFVFAAAATREFGLAAAYSVIKRDQQFAWLDHKRRFVVSDGRTYESISGPIQQTLDDMGTVSDCFGYRVHLGPVDALVWTFPSDGRTFVFHRGMWSQWSAWNSTTGWGQFPVTAHYQDPNTGRNLVGDSDGYVSELSMGVEADRGALIRAYIQTGFQGHGTEKRKHCRAVYVTLRRGETTSSVTPHCYVCFRDEPEAPWRKIPVSLGPAGARQPVVALRSLGTYRRRQWLFEFSGSEDLALVSAEEEFELGDT